MPCYITRSKDNDEGATVEVPEDLWIRVGQMVAEEIKRGRAHFVPNKKGKAKPCAKKP